MPDKRLLLDADGCPVVDEAVRIARTCGVECIILCDSAHVFDKEGARTVVCEKGADSVDFALVNLARRGDVVVTQDYGLAAMCLARGAIVLNQDGKAYTEENIGGLLMARHEAKKVRRAGGRMRGPKKRESVQDAQFARALMDILT